jgi:hypothetical protein
MFIPDLGSYSKMLFPETTPNGVFIPRKHTKQTYGQQRRAARKRANIRKHS